jgi:hypothetical protein
MTVEDLQRAETKMLALLDDAGLPAPDEIRYEDIQIRFVWNDRKVAVVVELDSFEEEESSP